MRSFVIAAVSVVAIGCASTPEGPPVQPVPVYEEGQVPCEYEELERVRIRRPTAPFTTMEDYRRRLERAYGEAGARVGADAVIAPLPDPNATGMARRREIGPGSATPTIPPMPPGTAIRLIPGTCG